MPKATRRARKRALPRDRCPCAVRQVLVVGRVVLNAPREMPPPHRRPSWNSWIRPSLTKARPSKARQVSVPSLCPSLSVASCASVCRPLSVRQKSVGKSVASPPRRRPSRNVARCRHQTNARPSAAGLMSVACPSRVRAKPVVRPRTQKERRANTRQTPPRRGTHPSEARTQSAPAANLKRTPPVQRPCAVPNLSLARTSQARGLSAMRP